METWNLFIDYIARTNLFNFVIFLSIIIFLIKKIKVSAMLESEKLAVASSIEDSNTAKVESETRLSSIEESISHINDEIEQIIKKSEENAQLVGEKILQEAQRTALTLQDNVDKAIENAHTILKNDLVKKASLASVEVAKAHIISELSRNSELHDKLIDDSIEAIKEVNEV